MKQPVLSFAAGLLSFTLFLAGCSEVPNAGPTQPDPSPASGSASASSHPPVTQSDVSGAEASSEPRPDFSQSPPEQPEPENEDGEEDTEMKLHVQIDGHIFEATLENNAAADALSEMLREAPVTIQMRDYAGFEKVGPLGASLPASDSQTTTQAGDIVLYTGNQIVIFYGSNSWSYTRLGRIDDLTGWEEALGSGDVTAIFSME